MSPHILRPEFALLGLELSRLSGVVAVSPIPWSNTPKRIKAGLLIFLLMVVHGQGHSPPVEIESAFWAATNASTEFIIGLSLGMVVRLSVAAAEIAGSLFSMQMGFTAAQ